MKRTGEKTIELSDIEVAIDAHFREALAAKPMKFSELLAKAASDHAVHEDDLSVGFVAWLYEEWWGACLPEDEGLRRRR